MRIKLEKNSVFKGMWSHVQVIKFKCLEAFNIQIFEHFGLLGLTFTLGIVSSHITNGES